MNAQSLAAANRYEAVVRSASSQLRESYFAYRTAYDLAKHYRDEIVPLRKTMSVRLGPGDQFKASDSSEAEHRPHKAARGGSNPPRTTTSLHAGLAHSARAPGF
jgi:hypothetical protein